MPLKGLGASIATPAVTNGGAPMGLAYLESFVSSCSGCSFDVINIHHYVQRSDCNVDQAVAALQKYIDETLPAIQNKHSQLKGLPVCIGEVRLFILFVFICFYLFFSLGLKIHKAKKQQKKNNKRIPFPQEI